MQIDALLSAGDPRGRLALDTPRVVSHRDLPGPARAIAETLLGPLQRPARHRLSWRHGYWHHFGNWSSSQHESFWAALFGDPSALALADLSLRWIEPELLLGLLREHGPPVRRLHWNERDDVVDFDPFFQALPDLRELHLWRPARFSRGSVQPLHILSVNAGHECPRVYTDLATYAEGGGLDALQSLILWGMDDFMTPESWLLRTLGSCEPNRLEFHGSITGGVVGPILASGVLDGVEHLALEGFWPDDDALEQLVAALEARNRPLASYRSTGREPPEPYRERLEWITDRAEISG